MPLFTLKYPGDYLVCGDVYAHFSSSNRSDSIYRVSRSYCKTYLNLSDPCLVWIPRRTFHREADRELGAFPEFALDGYRAAVRFDDVLDERKSESRAFRGLFHVFSAVEFVEYLRYVVNGYSYPGIGHNEYEPIVR